MDTENAYDSPLETRILAGDISGVMDLVDTLSPAERQAQMPAISRLIINRWSMRKDLDKPQLNRVFRAIELARFICSAEHPAADYWKHIGIQDIAAYRQRYQPALSGEPIDKQLRGEYAWHYLHHIHRAIIAGLVERPDSDEYMDALFFGDLRQETNIVLKHVDADPGLAPLLLRLFEREGTSDRSFASVEKYCHDPELYWSHAFLTLCTRGVYTRAQLLDKTLGALACDWPQFKSGWFSRFHEQLAPTVDEMAPFAARYLALCQSRIAPTVGLALDAVAALYKAGQVDDDALCEALQPVLTSAVKARVLAALELLSQVAKKTPACAHAISALAVQALSHSAADVQKKTIAYLQAWGLDAAGQETARNYLPLVAAVNQAALAKLVGNIAPPPPREQAAPATIPAAQPATTRSPWDASRALQPLTQIPDLVEAMAYALENPEDIDTWERVAEALVRMAPIAAADHPAFAALKKRTKRLEWGSKPLGFALARLMACAVDGEDTAPGIMKVQPDAAVNMPSFIAWRTYSLIEQARKGLGLTPLSSPTHRGGFLDPVQFATRTAAYAHAGTRLSAAEQAFAQMRMAAPRQPLQLDWHVTSTEPNEGGYVFHTLHVSCPHLPSAQHDHDYAALLCAKHLRASEYWSAAEPEASYIRFAACLQPSNLEPFFAEAARTLGNNLDWWEAQWQSRAYLDVLMQPTTAMTPMAVLSLALALAGKEPGQTALAVDALVLGVQDGRLDVPALGATLARLWATPIVKGPRYAKSLASAAQAHSTMPEAVFTLLCAMAEMQPESPRKDLAPLLELLLELQLAHHLPLPASTRTVLGAMHLGGKGRQAVQALLATPALA